MNLKAAFGGGAAAAESGLIAFFGVIGLEKLMVGFCKLYSHAGPYVPYKRRGGGLCPYDNTLRVKNAAGQFYNHVELCSRLKDFICLYAQARFRKICDKGCEFGGIYRAVSYGVAEGNPFAGFCCIIHNIVRRPHRLINYHYFIWV